MFFGLGVILVTLIISACEQDPALGPVSKIERLTAIIKTSPEFQNLNIPASSLSEPFFISRDEKSIGMYLNSGLKKKSVIALFNDNEELRDVAYFEVVTQLSAEQMQHQFKNKSFGGRLIFETQGRKFEFDIKNSRVINSQVLRTFGNAKIDCKGMTEQGGPLWCAGSRLENMNWFDTTICYLDIVLCMAQLVVSCIVDDCVVNPPQGASAS